MGVISVIDYCLLPHDKLSLFTEFEVHKTRDLLEKAGFLGIVADPAHFMLDHNLQTWCLELSSFVLPFDSQPCIGAIPPTASFTKCGR